METIQRPGGMPLLRASTMVLGLRWIEMSDVYCSTVVSVWTMCLIVWPRGLVRNRLRRSISVDSLLLYGSVSLYSVPVFVVSESVVLLCGRQLLAIIAPTKFCMCRRSRGWTLCPILSHSTLSLSWCYHNHTGVCSKMVSMVMVAITTDFNYNTG